MLCIVSNDYFGHQQVLGRWLTLIFRLLFRWYDHLSALRSRDAQILLQTKHQSSPIFFMYRKFVFNAFLKKLEAFHLNGNLNGFLPHHQKSSISMVFFHPKLIHFWGIQWVETPNGPNAWEVVERPTMLPASALAPAPRRE